MKILVIGATGPTGRELVAQSLELGHKVCAVVRNLATANLPSAVYLVRADVTNATSLLDAVASQDAVISSLGTRKIGRQPTTLFSDGTRNLIAAMNQSGVRRLVCITGVGAGDSKGHGGFLYDKIFNPLLLREIYKDKDRQEEIVRKSGLDWTIVRPGVLTNGPRTGVYRELTDLTGITMGKISRADVAASILAHIADVGMFKQTCNLTY